MVNTDTIWTASLDGVYKIKVVRIGEYQGEISISRAGKLIKKTQVPLAYDAVFGPDLSDVQAWQDWSVAIVDGERNAQSD
jgi:allophanate hydrolase subunit 1